MVFPFNFVHFFSTWGVVYDVNVLQSDPILEIAKSQEGGGYALVYRSQPLMKTLNPRFVT